MTTVALYARVSTKDKGQRPENQLPELWRFAQAWRWLIVRSSRRVRFSGTVRAASRKSRGVALALAMLAHAELLAHIAADFSREEFPAKCLLVEQGLRAKKLFYIEKGGPWLVYHRRGQRSNINFGFEGSFVSSMETLLAGASSWYNMETLEPTVVYSIGHPEFEELKTRSNYWQAVYVGYIEQRLLYYQHLFIARIKASPANRYRALLAQYPEIIWRVPQHYIASFLGITAVSLSRIRRRKWLLPATRQPGRALATAYPSG